MANGMVGIAARGMYAQGIGPIRGPMVCISYTPPPFGLYAQGIGPIRGPKQGTELLEGASCEGGIIRGAPCRQHHDGSAMPTAP